MRTLALGAGESLEESTAFEETPQLKPTSLIMAAENLVQWRKGNEW